MKVYTENDKPIVRCECGFKILDEMGMLRLRVAIVKDGQMCPKCPRCKRFDESFPISSLLKEEIICGLTTLKMS